ncbi:hypothetical protein LINPERPRIM_LOCUS16853 [Linum perenne]
MIDKAYKEFRHATKRSYSSMKSRFKAIRRAWNSWKGTLRKATEQRSSSESDNDVTNMVKEIFKSNNKNKALKEDDCWVILLQLDD